MGTWKPLAADELEQIVERELPACEPAQQEAFRQLRIAPRATPIVRGGSVEYVFAVAARGNEVLYYEDVEEGFNVSPLDAGGAIANPGFEQWELRHALHHWLGA
jgi:hypothetical protein